jgi:integration host factor subunit beta
MNSSSDKEKWMTRSDLINKLAAQQKGVTLKDSDLIVKIILEKMAATLCQKQRIEIRDFASFSLKTRQPRRARNPRTGESVIVSKRYHVHFKMGQGLFNRVNSK